MSSWAMQQWIIRRRIARPAEAPTLLYRRRSGGNGGRRIMVSSEQSPTKGSVVPKSVSMPAEVGFCGSESGILSRICISMPHYREHSLSFEQNPSSVLLAIGPCDSQSPKGGTGVNFGMNKRSALVPRAGDRLGGAAVQVLASEGARARMTDINAGGSPSTSAWPGSAHRTSPVRSSASTAV